VNVAAWLRYRALLATQRPRRYRDLFRTVYATRARRIVEVGTWNGVHARQLVETAAVHHALREVCYFGFDLFEALTDEALAREFSKRPPARAVVLALLERTGARIRLYAGDTRDTLPAAAGELTDIDLVFIDGGHAEATIASDWSNVERIMGPDTVVLFDDYYVDPAPQLTGLGCQSLIDGLDRARFEVAFPGPVDVFPQSWGELKIRLARVRRRR
jgi:predicted O-methyltransferase YrrM